MESMEPDENTGRESEILRHDMTTAGDIQKRLIPKEIPRIEGYEVATVYKPCAQISGDYYDFLKLDEVTTAMVVADVSGRGPVAGFLMSQVRTFLHSNPEAFRSPRAGALALNDFLHDSIPKGMFVRMTGWVLQGPTGQVTLVNCGHTSPIWFRSAQPEVKALPVEGMPLGLSSGEIVGQALKESRFQLLPGDLLIVCTDGVTEAENANGEEFETSRAAGVIKATGRQGAKAHAEALFRELRGFAGAAEWEDDITILALRRESMGSKGGPRVKMLTVAEAAQKLGMSPESVRASVKEGRIIGQFIEAIGDYMVPESELQRKSGPAPAARMKVLLVSEQSPFADTLLLELERNKKLEVKQSGYGASAVDSAKKFLPAAILFEFPRVEPDIAQALSNLRKACPAAECAVFYDELKISKRKPELDQILGLIGVKHVFDTQRGSRGIVALLAAKSAAGGV